MSNLSGYDSEAVGFDSAPPVRKESSAISTQTTEFGENGAESQTNMSKDVGCTASAEDFQTPAPDYPEGLNEFLRKVLLSSSSDGAINVWRVNVGQRTFENMVRYEVESGRKPRPDVTSFDIQKTHPLRVSGERTAEVFVVGTKSGEIFLCEVKDQLDSVVDPVSEILEGHNTCVLDVAFSRQKAGMFVSLSTDSELRVYRVGQIGPIRIICLDVSVSCLSWLGNSPCIVLGLAESNKEALRVYNVSTGKLVPVEGFLGSGCVTCVDVYESGCYRIVAGDAGNIVRIWELPTLRDKFLWDYNM